MYRRKNKYGFTLVELILAFAIIVIIFAAVVPQFMAIRNSWAGTEAKAEIIQNGRVLAEHITRNLAAAKQIVAVSSGSDLNGFITFQDNSGGTKRYMLAGGYVVFGDVGSEAQLAGPVDRFRISCYSLSDFANPTTDANAIRLVRFETNFPNDDALGTDKTFSSEVFVQTNAQSLCWQSRDIGSVGAVGTASSASCAWTIEGSGVDIWDTTDEFHYVYRSLSGDGQIIARVASVENTNAWAKAGVMIRETLNANSKHAMMVVTPGSGTAFQRRTSTGGISDNDNVTGRVAPYWVKLKRIGNTFSGYESSNGSAWTQVGSSVSITMASNVYIGLTVTSHSDGDLCTAVIDNVSSSGITYETFNEAKAAADTTSLIISTPTTNTGDLLIAAVATDGDTSASIAAPVGQGWTLIDRGSDTGSQVTLGAWWKLAGASEPNSTFTWTGSQQAYGWMMRFTGHNPTSPINTFLSASSSGSATPASPAVTTTVPNCLILRLGAFDDSNITVDNPGLSGHTAITMDKSAASSGGTVAILGSWLTGTTHAKESGTNRALVFIAHAKPGNNPTLTAVSYGGRSMTKVIEQSGGTGSNRTYVAAFILNDAGITAASTTTFTPTWSGTPTSVTYSSVFLQNVNQTTLTGVSAGSTVSGTTITTAALATGNGDMVLEAAACSATGTYTMNNSFTKDIDLSVTGYDGGCGHKSATGVSETPSVTHETGRQSLIGFVVQGGGFTGTVSGGAGYVRQANAGSSGTSTFTLGSSNEARTLTIAIAPADSGQDDCCQDNIMP